MAFPLTEEQRQAVENRGGGLLVSAAAGSGKTRVLVERLMDRVVNEGKNIDQFLVITYTRAAAAELRARIADELSVRMAERPGDRHLRRQTNLVYKAQISTIHSFCADLLRECGHLLDLEPDFRLCDEQEGGILRLRVLNEVLEERYESMSPEGEFAQLVDILSAGRDDSLLLQITLDIFDKIQSHPRPEQWLAEQGRAYELDGITDAGQTAWGKLLLEDAARQAEHWALKMREALALTDSNPGLAVNYGPTIAETIRSLSEFAAAAQRSWDEAAAAMPIRFPAAGRKKMGDGPEIERVKAVRATCKARMEKLAEWFSDDSEALLSDLRGVAPAVRGLFSLVSDFSDAFTREKGRRGILDFTDLEHFAVRLLTDPETGEATELAGQWSRRYEEIMVDEYQDTNEVQNAIFTALSRQGKNLFLVGDVKQSIYRFRLADPTIFLEKYRTFRPAAQAAEGEPRKLVLSRNFRSRPGVLSGVNDVFKNIMSTEFGEMEYTAEEMLYPGADYPPVDQPCVELDIIDTEDSGGEAEEGKTDRYLLEARFVARRISGLLKDGFPVTEGGVLRPVRPDDMVILFRSPGTMLHHYARALNERGIPWQAEGERDFFAATEVNIALSLLRVVDNPRQDVALISVLRSPVYGFSADRLAQLRAEETQGDFYAAVQSGSRRGERDCAAFLEELTALRFGAGEKSAHELVWDIYEQTGLFALCGAMPGGEERQSNLLTLYELARSCEESGHKGLFGFLTYLDRLQAAGGRVSVPGRVREGSGVRLLSIHKSKGLEFPVVFLCGLSKRLNREDMQKPVLFHPKLGVGPRWLDRERMIQSPTLARRAVARQLEKEMMAEELRLLYVAMTRAREKLVMTCTMADSEKTLQKLAEDSGCPVEAQALMMKESVAQWLVLSAMRRPEASVLRTGNGVSPASDGSFGLPWSIRIHPGAEYARADREKVTIRQAETGRIPEKMREQLTWQYPFRVCADIPSKLTATQLKGRMLDEEAAEQTPRPDRPKALRRPVFAEEELGLTPAQKGTAQHLVMQYLDFDRTGTLDEIREEISRMVSMALLTPGQGEAASPERVLAFFQSPLGRQVKASRGLRREFKFSILVPASDFYGGCPPGEEVLLQGVVDCWLDEPEGITLIDFKTDRVNEQSVLKRAEAYRPQLEAYQRALEEVTGRRVVRKALWFFALDREVDL